MCDEAKRFAEAMTMAYRRTHGVDTTIVRIFNTFGERMRRDDGRAIPTFVAQALAGEPVTVAGDGSQTRSVCYVSDLVDGVVRALEADLAGLVNLGRPEEMTVKALAELIVAMTGSSSPLVYTQHPEDGPCVRRPDITLARAALGWEPVVSIQEGLRRTIEFFQREDDERYGLRSELVHAS